MERIETQSDVLGGEPHISGRRVSVRQVVQMVHGTYSPDEVAEQLRLDREEVDTALDYYRRNRQEIQRHIDEERRLVEETLDESEAPTV